jgi:hypothetical protein
VEAVYVCAPARLARANEGENAVLLDPDGKRIAGARIDFTTEAAFVAGMERLLRRKARLEERAKRARTKEVGEVLGALSSEDKRERDRAHAFLVGAFEGCGPAVIAERIESASPRVREAAARVIREVFEKRAGATRREWLPFGVKWRQARVDPCPACGMAIVAEPSWKFLEFLSK